MRIGNTTSQIEIKMRSGGQKGQAVGAILPVIQDYLNGLALIAAVFGRMDLDSKSP